VQDFPLCIDLIINRVVSYIVTKLLLDYMNISGSTAAYFGF